MTDEILIKKARKGNWHAYLELALARKDLLYHKALTLLCNEQDAMDAVEEAILKGYNSISKLQQAQYFQTWLVRILINTCIDLQRQAQKTAYLHPLQDDGEVSSPDETIEARLDIRLQLDNMDPKHRTVIVLRYFEDLTIEEIAQILAVPAGTVKSRLYYGLKQLKIHMEGAQANEV